MAFMLPMMGMSLLSKLLPRKDGGSIPPSHAAERVGTGLPKLRPNYFNLKAAPPKPKKKGGAVKKKGKKRK